MFMEEECSGRCPDTLITTATSQTAAIATATGFDLQEPCECNL